MPVTTSAFTLQELTFLQVLGFLFFFFTSGNDIFRLYGFNLNQEKYDNEETVLQYRSVSFLVAGYLLG